METPVGKPVTDYTLFDLTDEFYFEEVAWYWNGLIADCSGTDLDKKDNLPPEVYMLIRYLWIALEKGLLKSESYAEYKRRVDNDEVRDNYYEIKFSRKDLIEFALSQGKKPLFLFPEERGKTINKEQEAIERLKGEVQNLQTENNVIKAKTETLFLNKDHPNYSKELEAAVCAWQALFSSGKNVKTGNTTPKRLIEEWLKKNRPDFSKEAIMRIQVLCNPDISKTGGVPKTEDI